VKYIQNFDSLKDYLISKKENGWRFGVGYEVSHSNEESEEWLLENGFSKASWLTDKETVITDSFTEDHFETELETNKIFRRPGSTKKEIFKAPHILFKGNLGTDSLPVHYVEEYLIFRNKITGIYAPRKDEHLLRQVYSWLKSNPKFLRFIISLISNQAGVTMSSKVLMSKDILALPYPKEGEISLSKSEKVLIDEVLKYGIKSKQAISNSPYETLVKDTNLNLFGELFCEALNPIYENELNQWFIHAFQTTEEYTEYAFCYGTKSNWNGSILELNSQETYLEILQSTQGYVKYTRVLRKYLHIDGFDILILIKPSTVRYWLGSIALRDADETFSDLKRIGK
jgi:hypothetical protein